MMLCTGGGVAGAKGSFDKETLFLIAQDDKGSAPARWVAEDKSKWSKRQSLLWLLWSDSWLERRAVVRPSRNLAKKTDLQKAGCYSLNEKSEEDVCGSHELHAF